MTRDSYQTPLATRYASEKMLYIFSDESKYKTWRACWIILAEAQKELGLKINGREISWEQIGEMKKNLTNIDYNLIRKKENEVKHEVLAHLAAFGEQCPNAKPIIHLGATSAYVIDNTELLQMKFGLELIRKRLVNTIYLLDKFAYNYKDLVTLAFTHGQPAQPTTVGKRATLWIQDLIFDFEDLEYRLSNLKALGVKGATGTQASFLELFDGDEEKVRKLDELVIKKLMEFSKSYEVTGQTYPRKVDYQILSVLAGIGGSAHKFSTDLRLLQSRKEIEEPFGEKQKGSSAMPYKRNPMKSERISSLSRHVMPLAFESLMTSALQWFERSLDDSAGKRMYIPEAFLTIDSVLNLYMSIADNILVYPKVIEKNLKEELPFMITENIIMEAVKNGSDRQEIHSIIRDHAMEVDRRIKEGLNNDLLDRIINDSRVSLTKGDIERLIKDSKLEGCAVSQVERFRNEVVKPILEKYNDFLDPRYKVDV